MGFVRRFSNYPPASQITEIEGVVIIDLTTPGAINGVGSGVACIIGEFADVTLGVAISAAGVVTTSPQPTEVFGSQDLANKVGGFDETIGEFGGTGGSGWLELKNKSFSRLVVVPINIAASQGIRLWRKLATNSSATDPSAVTTTTPAVVPAGREFKSGSNRVRTMQMVSFSGTEDFTRGIDGVVTHIGSVGATGAFSSAGGGFTTVTRPDGTAGVKVGDILVLGVIGGAGSLGADADTYRVNTISSDTALLLEHMDGSTFDFTAGTALPWRIHTYDVADTGVQCVLATQAGYRIPCRPLDATITTTTSLTPTIVPPAATADNVDPLSGLTARTDTSVGVVYVAAIHAPNTTVNATLEALYTGAFDACLGDDEPEREVNIIWAARYSNVIDQKATSHALVAIQTGIGRVSITSPAISQVNATTSLGSGVGGVGNARARENIFSWPGFQTFCSELVPFSIKGADGVTHNDGIADTPASGWLASCLSQLAPERNVGQSSDPIKTIMSATLGIQRGISPSLDLSFYKAAKAAGICAGRNDRDLGRIFQSDVTRSLVPGEQLIRVRRFSFFIQDSLATYLAPLSKEPLSEDLKDHILTAHVDFFEQLLSTGNPAAQRIAAYSLDPISGNTQELEDAGIYVVIHKCEMLATADDIVLQSQVGYGVLTITQSA